MQIKLIPDNFLFAVQVKIETMLKYRNLIQHFFCSACSVCSAFIYFEDSENEEKNYFGIYRFEKIFILQFSYISMVTSTNNFPSIFNNIKIDSYIKIFSL